ncbi:MAG: hypothetical protein IKQ31_04345 [Clostridia bacterium]|nr:hypothetical protein [Clostridia bacterium]
MNYTFFGKEYDDKTIFPALKEKIEFLQYEQGRNIEQLKGLITPLTELVAKLEEMGVVETPEERIHREQALPVLAEKSKKTLEDFLALREKNCESMETLLKGVERDVATLKMGNVAVKKIFDLIDKYVSDKKVSMLKTMIAEMQRYVDNDAYSKSYDCYLKAYNKFIN